MKQKINAVWSAVKTHAFRWQTWKRIGPLLGMAVVGVVAFFWGRQGALSQTKVQSDMPHVLPVHHVAAKSDYARRVVAYIYGNIPITRQDLGEYLIERFGKKRLEFLINRRIVEMACQSKGIYVTKAEIEAQLKEDLQKFNPPIKLKDFEQYVLRKFNKTLFEWKEDVIRPKLAIAKLVRSNIHVTDEEIQKAFQASYGPKVQCRMIVLQKDDRHRFDKYEKARKSEKGFAELARTQFVTQLAARGGRVPPIHKFFGDPRLEKEAFSLKEGQCSRLLQMPDGTYVILKCDKHLEADSTRRLSEERDMLKNRIAEFKLAQEIPKVVQQLRAQAHPKILMQDARIGQRELPESTLKKIRPKTDKAIKQASGQVPSPTVPQIMPATKGPQQIAPLPIQGGADNARPPSPLPSLPPSPLHMQEK